MFKDKGQPRCGLMVSDSMVTTGMIAVPGTITRASNLSYILPAVCGILDRLEVLPWLISSDHRYYGTLAASLRRWLVNVTIQICHIAFVNTSLKRLLLIVSNEITLALSIIEICLVIKKRSNESFYVSIKIAMNSMNLSLSTNFWSTSGYRERSSHTIFIDRAGNPDIFTLF